MKPYLSLHPIIVRATCLGVTMGAILSLSACAVTERGALLRTEKDRPDWGKVSPDRREIAPATAALLNELDRVAQSLRDERTVLTETGLSDDLRNVAKERIRGFDDLRRQIEQVLIDSPQTAPHRRSFREFIYADPPLAEGFTPNALRQNLEFVQHRLPLYDARLASGSNSVFELIPENRETVYTGDADYGAVGARWSLGKMRLFEAGYAPRVIRFAPRFAEVENMTGWFRGLETDDCSTKIPSIVGTDLPSIFENGAQARPAIRMAVFTAGRKAADTADAVTDALSFYWWTATGEKEKSAGDDRLRKDIFLGLDYAVLPAETPEPVLIGDDASTAPLSPTDVSYARVALSLPFEVPTRLLVGAKQSAGEFLKAPFNSIYHILRLEPGPAVKSWFRPLRKMKPIWRVQTGAWPLAWPHESLMTLAGEIPVLGSFGWNRLSENQSTPEPEREDPHHVFLTRGTGGGDGEAQFTSAWAQAMASAHAGSAEENQNSSFPQALSVSTIPYLRGTAVDTIWSALNLSKGPGYEMADAMLFPSLTSGNPAVRPGAPVLIAAHGGGVQRAVDAARVLDRAGLKTSRLVGYDGRSVGNINGMNPANGRFTLYRSGGFGRGARAGERAMERLVAGSHQLLVWGLNLPLLPFFRTAPFTPFSENTVAWEIDSDTAGRIPGGFNPETGTFAYQPIEDFAASIEPDIP